MAFSTGMQGYQTVKEKLPGLCHGPDCAIRAVREAFHKGRGHWGVRGGVWCGPPDKSDCLPFGSSLPAPHCHAPGTLCSPQTHRVTPPQTSPLFPPLPSPRFVLFTPSLLLSPPPPLNHSLSSSLPRHIVFLTPAKIITLPSSFIQQIFPNLMY